MKKRLLSMILSLCLALSLLPAQAFAAERLSYVALGDSITTGYGLGEDEESFATRLAEMGNFQLNDSLAKDGVTSADLLAVVQAETNTETLRNADVITITIGGNDLMNALYEFLRDKYNAENPSANVDADQIKDMLMNSNIVTISKLLKYIIDEKNSDDLQAAMTRAISLAAINFRSIITSLKALNQNATIIVATQYNPYEYAAKHANPYISDKAQLISDLFETILEKLNTSLMSYASLSGYYQCADVSAAFSNAVSDDKDPCNATFVDLSNMNFDFHPNAYGHELIAETMSEYALQYSISVTPDTLTFDTATEGYTDSKAQTVTITNTGNQEVTVDLPVGKAYIITAKGGFSNGKATLAVNEQATFTVQPKVGFAAGTYKETIAVTGSNDITENITATFTVEEKKAVPTQPGTENQNPAQTGTENQTPQTGTVLQDTAIGDIYKVTESGKEVEYVKSGSKSKKTEKIPATVTINGIRYTVTSVANNAFKNNKKVETVVIGKNVTKIGKKAFYGCKNLKKITIKSTKLKKKTIGAKAFTKAGSKNYGKLKVIVPKKCLKNYTKILKQKGLSKRAVIK